MTAAETLQVTIGVEEGPHYVGDPVLVRVTATGVEENPQPTCDPSLATDQITIHHLSIRPSIQSFTQVINGKVTQYKSISYTFDFHVIASHAGPHKIQPFIVTQNKKQAKTQVLDLQIQEVDVDPNMKVMLHIPDTPIYPGQRTPILVQWWYAGDINSIRNLKIRSPLFEDFTFLDEPADPQESVLVIEKNHELLRLKATTEHTTLDGINYVVMSATRQLVADQPGEYNIGPISAYVEKVTRWSRDFFGNRRPIASKRLCALGLSHKLIVQPIPIAKAPPTFSGTVGHGFTFDVRVDRSVVQVGDPITLQVTLRGDGDLNIARLPPIANEEGGNLDSKYFRVANEDIPGTVSKDGNSKHFDVSVRVLDETVRQIPPLVYAWFDPSKGRFETTQSDPIALKVLPAEIVSANQVIITKRDENTVLEESTEKNSSHETLSRPQYFDLTGADLAITSNLDKLLIDDGSLMGGRTTRLLIYFSGIALMAGAWIWRRSAQLDPEIVRRRRIIKQQIIHLNRTRQLPRQRAAVEVAAALRQLSAYANSAQRQQIDYLLADYDAIAFAPVNNQSNTTDTALLDKATRLAQSIPWRPND